MAMEPSDQDEERVKEQVGESGEVKNVCKHMVVKFYLDTLDQKKLQTRFQLSHRSELLTRDALALLIDGVMWRARSINRAAQLLRFLIGCRLYELDR